MKNLNSLLGFFMLVTVLSGCSVRHVDEPLQNTTTVPDKQESVASDTLTADPDHPLIKEFGDIPEVRTYIRLQKKLRRGSGLTIDEAIELYTVEAHLYPSLEAKARLMLIDLKADKRRYQRLGIPFDQPVLTSGDVSKENLPPPDFVLVHPFKDDPDHPSPHNPLIKKFGDIPEVRTYIRLQKKFRYGSGLTVDEAIALYTAEAHLYPSLEAKARLKSWIKDKERYQRLGILTDKPVMGFKRKADTSDDASADTENAD